jgi:hypothetical protein
MSCEEEDTWTLGSFIKSSSELVIHFFATLGSLLNARR